MELEYKKHTCISCGVIFCITKEHDRELYRNKKSFYCPNGHPQNYVGKTAEQLLSEEKEKSKRYYSFYESEQQTTEKLRLSNRTLKGHLTRYKQKKNTNR